MWCGYHCCTSTVEFAQGHTAYSVGSAQCKGCNLKAKVPPMKPEWVDMFKNDQDSCPDVLQLIDLLLSLPASSADCKRGFCLVKVIKSDWKSRLRGTVVTDLMTVQLHSPEIATLIHP